jgi:hypothetical protein
MLSYKHPKYLNTWTVSSANQILFFINSTNLIGFTKNLYICCCLTTVLLFTYPERLRERPCEVLATYTGMAGKRC